MTSDTVTALLRCHFGGPKERAQAHATVRVELYALPSLEVAIEEWIMRGAVPDRPFVALVLLDPMGRLRLESGPAMIVAPDVALPIGHHEADVLPEIEAGRMATRMAGDFWDLRPLAQLSVPLARPLPRHGTTGLLYLARATSLHPPGVHTVDLVELPALDALVPSLRDVRPPPIEELIEPAKGRKRRFLHNLLVKPCFRSRRKLAELLAAATADATTLIDVSAGDDRLALDLAHAGMDLVVLNDLAFGALEHAARDARRHALTNVVLTNQAAQNLSFPKPFDVAIIKNTLHHLEDAAQITATLEVLNRLARRIVFVEIEEPARTLRSRCWNFYYERMLGDGAEHHRYLNRVCFKRLLRTYYGPARVNFVQVPCSRGNYMVCTIKSREDA